VCTFAYSLCTLCVHFAFGNGLGFVSGGRFGNGLGLVWGRFGVGLGSVWKWFGVSLGSV